MIGARSGGRRESALFLIPAGVVAAFAGLLIASEVGLFLLAVLLAVFVVLPASYFLGNRFADRNGWLLYFGWAAMLVAYVSQQLAHLPLGYVQEVLLFGLSLGIAAQLLQLSEQDRALRGIIVIWLLLTGLGLISTVFGRSHRIPALWQMQYNLKWPLMFALGCLLAWGDRPERQLARIAAWSWIVIAPCVALEIAAPGAFHAIFGEYRDSTSNPILGWGLRYRGPFSHSGYLAIIGALLGSIAVVQVIAGRSRLWLLPAAIYGILVLLSGQRQELMGLALTAALFIAILNWRQWYLVLAAALAVAVFAGGTLIYLDHVPMRATLEQWGVLSSTASLSERAILTYSGIEIAQQYFPLGSGLGTYGGVGALKFDQSLFLDMGFGRYWWFRLNLFLVDTFWPNVIAEAGFFGAVLLFAIFAIMWHTLLRRTLRARGGPLFPLCLMALGSLTLMLANSPTSGVLTDPRGAFLFWMLIGAAWRASGPNADPATRAWLARGK